MEKETRCPTFAGELHTCFVETTDEGFESYLCFDCGYTSNSALKIGTEECKQQTKNYTSLVKDLFSASNFFCSCSIISGRWGARNE